MRWDKQIWELNPNTFKQEEKAQKKLIGEQYDCQWYSYPPKTRWNEIIRFDLSFEYLLHHAQNKTSGRTTVEIEDSKQKQKSSADLSNGHFKQFPNYLWCVTGNCNVKKSLYKGSFNLYPFLNNSKFCDQR